MTFELLYNRIMARVAKQPLKPVCFWHNGHLYTGLDTGHRTPEWLALSRLTQRLSDAGLRNIEKGWKR